MSQVRIGRGREYQFFRREDVRTRWDLNAATQFVRGFRGDSVAMSEFRREVLKSNEIDSTKTVSDDQVIATIARMLVSGEIFAVFPTRLTKLAHLSKAAPVEAAAAPAPAPASRQEEEDPNTFVPEHDGVAQAETLIAAARAAYPFCEECQRAYAESHQGAPA